MIKTWHPHAKHIIDSINAIHNFMQRGDLASDRMVLDAILRNLHMLTESTHHIPQQIKDLYPDIRWNKIRGFRNFIVHDYLGDNIDTITLTEIIDIHLPVLKKTVEEMLERFP